jgi:hypothetical protein
MGNLKDKGPNKLNKNLTQIKNCPKTIQEINTKGNLIAKSNILNKKNLKIYHQNICGLQFKSEELLVSLYPELILCITEHHLNTVQIQLVSLDEYNLGTEFCRQTYHKGDCMFILKRYSFSVINIVKYCKDTELEVCALKLKFSIIKMCILTIYRSPRRNFRFF